MNKFVMLVTAIIMYCAVIKSAACLDGVRNTFVMFVTSIVIHSAVIYICRHSGLREEYVCVACYCYCNALRCEIYVLPFWTAAGIRLCCLLLQLYCTALWCRSAAVLDGAGNVCGACYCNCNALRCVIDLLPVWSAAGICCETCYCKWNALRFDIDLLPFWTAGGIRLFCLLLLL